MPTARPWMLLTNHGVCLWLLATGQGGTVHEMAESMGMTERSAARILADLRAERYLSVRRDGRRNRYSVNLDAPLRHPIGRGYHLRDLLPHVEVAGDDSGRPEEPARESPVRE